LGRGSSPSGRMVRSWVRALEGGGGFALRDGELRFEPRRLESPGAPIPERFTQNLVQRASVAYPVETSFGEASRVELREDGLVLTGEVSLPVGEQWWLVASVGSL
jgi:hypothetical protein